MRSTTIEARRAARRVREGALEPVAAAGMAYRAARTASRSSSSAARRASRPARPACSTTPPPARRACWAAASFVPRCRSATSRNAGRWECRRRRLRRDNSGAGRWHGSASGAHGTQAQPRENPLDSDRVEQAYARWAPVYDVVFGAVFALGRAAAIQAAERVGGRILEVGVGTGISLPDYSRNNRLVGVDICEPMLRKAKERVAAQGLSHVEMLAVMDGTQARLRRRLLRRRGGAVRDHRGARSGSDARRIRAGGAAGRRDRAGQPLRHRGGAAAHAGARLCARLPAASAGGRNFPFRRLVRLVDAGGPAPARAPADPAARPVLAAALRQGGGVTWTWSERRGPAPATALPTRTMHGLPRRASARRPAQAAPPKLDTVSPGFLYPAAQGGRRSRRPRRRSSSAGQSGGIIIRVSGVQIPPPLPRPPHY